MKRLLCGSVVLATSLVLVSCNGDPTSDFRGGPSQILADPSTVFVNQSAVEEVVVTLVDDQGDPLPGTWEIAEPGSGISVERNPDFLGTTVGAPLESQAQFIVTAGDVPTGTSFTLASGELSLEIPVNVTPTAIATAAFSNPTPALNEPVTLTAEGYTFLPDAAVVIAGDSAAILSNDGTTVTFVPTPGSTGPATVEKIAINFLPTTPLTLPTAAEITVPPAPVPGTGAPATAPALPVPAVDEFSVFFDEPDFVSTLDRFYKLTIAEAGVYTVTLDWDIGDDIDMFLCPPPGDIVAECDFSGATGDHPESVAFDLAPGDYWVVADDFGQFAGGLAAIGAQLRITVEHAAPGATLRRFPSAAQPKRRM
jgi:hypothetical protein